MIFSQLLTTIHTSKSSCKLCANSKLLGNFAIYCQNGVDKLWFLFNDNARCKIIEKVISGTTCGQNTQQLIRFFDPDASHQTNATRKQSIRQHAGCRPDNSYFGILPGYLQNFFRGVIHQCYTGNNQHISRSDGFFGLVNGYKIVRSLLGNNRRWSDRHWRHGVPYLIFWRFQPN